MMIHLIEVKIYCICFLAMVAVRNIKKGICPTSRKREAGVGLEGEQTNHTFFVVFVPHFLLMH